METTISGYARNAIYYIRASSFCNKDILGPKFFKTQLDTLDMDEFLTAICAIRHKEVTNKFFTTYDHERHQFKDSYIYDQILEIEPQGPLYPDRSLSSSLR